jgi:hypothetical protein
MTVVLELLLVAVLFGLSGFVLGLRPTRHDRPTRFLVALGLCSVPVGLAACILLSDDWMAKLRGWIDPMGFALNMILSLVSVGGAVALIPLWGYAIGRTTNWARSGNGTRGTSLSDDMYSKRTSTWE